MLASCSLGSLLSRLYEKRVCHGQPLEEVWAVGQWNDETGICLCAPEGNALRAGWDLLPAHLQQREARPAVAFSKSQVFCALLVKGRVSFIFRYTARSTVEWARSKTEFITHFHVLFLQGPHLV